LQKSSTAYAPVCGEVAKGAESMRRKCLVTGGAGFIGSHLVDKLVAEHWQVRVLDDLSSGSLRNLRAVKERIEFSVGSIVDPEAVRQSVADQEVVFHLAARPSVERSVEDPVATHQVCATGTLQVLEAARKAKVRRIVYAASSSAYGATPGALRNETDPTVPLSPYAAAKLAGEHFCQVWTTLYGLETVRLRFFNVFGPRQLGNSPYSGVIALFCKAMLDGRVPVIHGDGLQSRDFTFIANVVQALVKAADARGVAGRVYNIASGSSVTLLDLVRQLTEITETDFHVTFGPSRLGDVRHSRADISRARRELDYEPTVNFSSGLGLTLDALRVDGHFQQVDQTAHELNHGNDASNNARDEVHSAHVAARLST
jgi:UDP-glucose 4-epimerase